MKTKSLKTYGALLAAASATTFASIACAQDSSAAATTADVTATPSAPQPAPTPQLAYGVSEIIRLSQAKVGDDTIIAYIRNSGNSYGLSADQIIYLQQQGVSTPVINTMLTQPKPGVQDYNTPATAAMPAATPYDAQAQATQPAPASSSIVGPSVTAIDPSAAAASSYYYYPPTYYYSYPAYYPAYGYYGFYPGVSISLGWRGGYGGWHGGYGGWHGGFGWHGGGGFHGGWRR